MADPVGFACRLLRKAHRRGVRILVTAPGGVLQTLDDALWSFERTEFVPHVRVPGSSAAAVQMRTPIWLAESVAAGLQGGAERAGAAAPPGVLLNIGGASPPADSPFERLIEIVGLDAHAIDEGRRRWRDYKARGLAVRHHAGATV